MKKTDVTNVKLSVTFAELDSLATLVSYLDGPNTVQQRNQYAAQAHAKLTEMLGEYAVLVYGVEDEPIIEESNYFDGDISPLERFRAEQGLKNQGVVYANSQLQDSRHEVGAFARVLHEVKAWCKKVSAPGSCGSAT